MSKWEAFIDAAYFDTWCVKRKDQARFGDGFHVHSRGEALRLRDHLNETEQRRNVELHTELDAMTKKWKREKVDRIKLQRGKPCGRKACTMKGECGE